MPVMKHRVMLLLVMVECIVSTYGVKDSKEHFTKHWIAKFKSFFDNTDPNGDGIVTKEEYIDATAKRAGKVLESWRAKAVYGIMSELYLYWWSNTNTNYKTSMTFEEWLPAIEKELGNSSEEVFRDSWDWFHTFDLDCDARLTLDEYSNFLFVIHNTASVQDIFKVIDHDANGILDGEEFTNAFRHAFFDQNASPDEIIFGS
ncbi:uncharacterized protein LOC106172796 [Lingula anatina]|uniref:Uncharacterized protein LOC106172796 n=1 Tax=Lingula anatina TaxID=7574 RepID=A0A1S3JFG0_LINAN|nr:uncharacterized protein LOC106172796 [Lingula anatina]|eukprot:XP_013409152.1 uncharacterized protein LOC106172796 [Lingula anatina]